MENKTEEINLDEAANHLHVSKNYLLKLIQENALQCRLVGSNYRFIKSDVLNFKKSIDTQREEALDTLVAEAQDQEMGY